MTDNKLLIISEDTELISVLGGNQGEPVDCQDKLYAVIDKESPAMLIIDAQVPSLAGIELSLEIRNTIDTPVMPVSNWDSPAGMLRVIDLTGENYVTEPFTIAEIKNKINYPINRTR